MNLNFQFLFIILKRIDRIGPGSFDRVISHREEGQSEHQQGGEEEKRPTDIGVESKRG